MNHYVNECINQDIDESDRLKRSIMKLSRRDVIEQLIFDPQLGIVKREIHYGIIDYLTVSNIIYLLNNYFRPTQ